MSVPNASWFVAKVSIARAIIFGTIRFRLLAAIVSATIVRMSREYGFSSAVSFGPAGRAGFFESGTDV